MEVKTRAKKWGSSLAIVLPRAIAEAKRIKADDEVVIEIKNRPLAREFFGKFPRKSKRTAQELKDSARAGWD